MKLPTLSSPLKLFQPAPALPALGAAGIGGSMMFSSRGGGGGYDPDDDFEDYDVYDDAPPPEPERRPRAARSSRSGGGDEGGPPSGGRPRTSQFQPEERYWTDYLRIALPVIGLLLMIGLLWFWADQLINDDPDTTESAATEDIGLVNTASPTPPPAEIQSTPPPANTDVETETTPPPADTTEAQPTEPPADETGEEEAPPPDEEPADTGGTFTSGQNVVVANADVLNLRPNPSTEGDPIGELAAGDSLVILSGPEEGEDFIWWEVQTADGASTGWVVEDYLEAAE